MTSLAIAGIGVCATGMANWAQAQAILDSPALPALDPLPRLAPECLPPVERRRANATTRLAITAAMQAIQGVPPEEVARLATIFSSSDGDGEVLANMLTALAQPQVVLSPTLFHNSVFNAPAGYWSIGSHARAASITVSAGAASFVAGLEEAQGQVLAKGAAVLYIAYDAPFPAALTSFARSTAPFACALRLVPVAESRANGYGRIEELGPDPGPDGPGSTATDGPARAIFRERRRGGVAAPASNCQRPPRGGRASLSRRIPPVVRLPALITDRAMIASLIPQQGTMCLLDTIEYWDGRRIICTSMQHRSVENPLRSRNALSSLHGIEFAAQAVAAHGGLTATGHVATPCRAVAECAGLQIPPAPAGRHRGATRHRGRING